MRIEANSLKVKNIMLMLLCALTVPTARVLERHAAQSADTAAWLSPLFAALMYLPYAAILIKLISAHPNAALSDINRSVLGKRIGAVINAVYVFWFLILAGYYLCQFSERMATTVYAQTSSAIFVCMFLITVSYVLHRGQEPLIKAAALFFFAVIFVYILSLLCLIPSVKIEYHLPVTKDLTFGAMAGGVQIFSALTYTILLLTFLDKVKTGNKKRALYAGGLFILLLSAATIFVTIGLFSAPVVKSMPFPFFAAIKEIRLFDSVERIESVILSIMMLGDFSIVSLFILCGGRTAKSAFRLKDDISFDLFILAAFTVSLFFSFYSVRLNEISETVIVPLNIAVGAGIPCLTIAVYGIKTLYRKKMKG